jgi:hypothetical protein
MPLTLNYVNKTSNQRRKQAFLVTLGMLSLLACFRSFASDSPNVTIEAVLIGSGLGNQLSGDDVAAETIRIKGDSLRVDFDAGVGRRGRVLRKNAGHAWLLMSTSHRALPADQVSIAKMTRLDPARRCWEPNLSCEKVDDRRIAGRQANGWRYPHAEQNGPGGTDSGVFWIDEQYGFLLSYKGEDLTGKTHRMETTFIQFAKLPDDDFFFPEGVRGDIEKADARASSCRGGK